MRQTFRTLRPTLSSFQTPSHTLYLPTLLYKTKVDMSRICLLITILLLLPGCIEYHPYDMRISGETGVNARNIQRIEEGCRGRNTIRFAVIGDTQRWYDETQEAVEAINRRNDIDFVIHTGDMANFGMRKEFELQRDILNGLACPYVCLLGNHDCLGNGYLIFQEIFGSYDFAFTAGNTRIVCLNMNALDFDHTMTIPNFQFLDNELAHFPAEAQKSVLVMHADPLSDIADRGSAQIFRRYTEHFPSLQFCVNGHGHNYKESDLFDNGTIYYQCDAIEKRYLLIFTLNDEGYTHERIPF